MTNYDGEERRKIPQIVETLMSRADMDELVERLTEAQAASIASGIKAAVTDEVALKFWMSGIRALQEHAAEQPAAPTTPLAAHQTRAATTAALAVVSRQPEHQL